MQTRFASALVMGRLKSDPVYAAAADGESARAEFAVGYSTARDGECDGECAESIPVIAHAGQADVVRDNLRAGDLVCVDGKIDTWQPDEKFAGAKAPPRKKNQKSDFPFDKSLRVC